MTQPTDPIWDMMGQLFQQHPWHGVTIGPDAPELVTCYVEMVSNDTIKYELDKVTGHLKVDRPQKYSNICPTLYGLIPQTYCAEKVAERCNERLDRDDIVGDNDPLDVCILTEKNINHGNFFLQAGHSIGEAALIGLLHGARSLSGLGRSQCRRAGVAPGCAIARP